MLAHLAPSSPVVIAMLAICLIMVLAFEASNGFHDSSNAVATVIYTNSLEPVPAVIWSGVMNLIGVLVRGISVAYAPCWVRVISIICLGAGTMVGYRRVVRTLGEGLGRQHMTLGQGASSELVGSILIGTAGFT